MKKHIQFLSSLYALVTHTNINYGSAELDSLGQCCVKCDV